MKCKGQSMLETLIVLPLFLLMLAAAVQGLWILLAQQMLQAASLHVVRQASLTGGDSLAMLQVLESRMRPLPGSRLHIPDIKRLHPSDRLIREQGDRVVSEGRVFYQLSSDFAGARLASLHETEREAWLRARIFKVGITWCQSLLVPMMAQTLQPFLRSSTSPAQQYCNLQSSGREPMLAIQVTAATQMIAPLEIAGAITD
ncbi:hypothetical protein CWE09_00260 [Aliidiomarina minuta]|uniref:TadE-like domain-containing protein n=1 Tax=Aliidiomarina minuta TaxID=880057 RepID=A0A432W569_9GAMM|nr:TadE family protein [Aliidiomarina minuta]RUO25215.1 hypothetical protein CWE09_00260 [Aliidiomarina minuta]